MYSQVQFLAKIGQIGKFSTRKQVSLRYMHPTPRWLDLIRCPYVSIPNLPTLDENKYPILSLPW